MKHLPLLQSEAFLEYRTDKAVSRNGRISVLEAVKAARKAAVALLVLVGFVRDAQVAAAAVAGAPLSVVVKRVAFL